MRVLLIEPKYSYREALSWIPIGKGYLATQARRLGHDVKIFDRALHKLAADTVLEQLITDFKPDVIGTGGMTLQWSDAKLIVAKARRLAPQALIVGGGVHVTSLPEDGATVFDLAVVGEGERAFREILEIYGSEKSKDTKLYKNIAGIVFYDENGQLYQGPPRTFIQDLDTLGLPSYDLLDVPLYHDHLVDGPRAISIMTGRGCPFECEFCASPFITARRVRNFSLDAVFDQIAYLNKTYGFEAFRIMDDTFAAMKKRVVQFCDEAQKRGAIYHYNCLTHVNTANKEAFDAMAKTGFTVVAFGVESASDRVLELINKKTTKAQAITAVTMARDGGLKPECLFMIGNIGDTEESIYESIQFARDYNKAFVNGDRRGFNWFQFATPFPGSDLYHDAPKYGTVLTTNYDDYSHQVPVFVPDDMDYGTMIRLRNLGMQTNNP